MQQENSDANVHDIPSSSSPDHHQKKTPLAVNQLEHIVEDEIAAGAVGQELENLGVVHGAFLFIDLGRKGQ